MKIRELDGKDIFNVINFLEKCVTEMPKEKQGFDRNSVEIILAGVIGNREKEVFILEEKKEIYGIAGISIVSNICNLREMWAYEFIWHSDPELSKKKRIIVQWALLKHMDDWAKRKKCKVFCIGANIKNSMGKMLEREGFNYIEKSYAKELR